MLEFFRCNSTNQLCIAFITVENISGNCGWYLTLIAFWIALMSRSRLFMASIRRNSSSAI